ncbi:ubiquitin carboxyl-terminal hydrolase 37 isoform X2 [Lates calcarifer]|uniref:Ubiquitin carboxyl-terminal hydrolase n=1 Tax=Lates calcarifer TaxID=8187 RepID=A0AAJ7PC81_LATCA|nr:ubiquitin carboxyl-terminal hydrolase 37 isoform X2 [Lates calcarifer]
MFRLCCGKYSTAVVELVAEKIRNVPAPSAPFAIQDNDNTAPLTYRLFGRPLTKTKKEGKDQEEAKENVTTKKNQKAKKSRRWRCRKNRCRVSPAPQEEETPEKEREPVKDEGIPQALSVKKEEVAVTTEKKLRSEHIKCLGFPNPAQICYINSSLQSLLTLEDFVTAISHQEQVWSLIPEAAVLRTFNNISEHHFSGDAQEKLRLLAAFKRAVALWAPEFGDHQQKVSEQIQWCVVSSDSFSFKLCTTVLCVCVYLQDAHEFLTAVLDQIRYWGPQLQVLTAGMGRAYSCPVEDHLMFKMRNTRTCKSCGAGSTREEDFTNLSLDLPAGGGTVEKMLDNYLMETELEYRCECGATKSGQCSSFATLPRVLVLHLKRFRYTPTFQLEKIHDPVDLQRELVVSSGQDGACYSLVSTINHIGTTARSGHYICDGVDPDVGPVDLTDRWFTYNDTVVTQTSGVNVCNQRQRSSYILFYRRHPED